MHGISVTLTILQNETRFLDSNVSLFTVVDADDLSELRLQQLVEGIFGQ